MATLKEIAEQVGVSVALVSKVLNNSRGASGASKKTAALIRETAARVGYRRNRAAVALRAGRQNAIGVIVHKAGAAGSGITEAMVESLAVEAGRLDLRQELALYETAEEFAKVLDRMDGSVVDGLILAGVAHMEHVERLAAVQRGGLPIITLYDTSKHDELRNVGCDAREASRMATQHLVEQGCKRIAHVSRFGVGPRFDGYREAMLAAGIEPPAEWIYAGREDPITRRAGEEAVAVLEYRGVDFDGLVCHCDLYAMGAMRALTQKGKRVPEDVRVIGLDDSPYCDLLPVTLSSVSHVLVERCRVAVDMLMKLREGRDVKSVMLEPQLHVRESTQ